MRMHDGRKPAPAGPLFGLSPEEAWRRFAFSGRQPCEVYAHPGPWFVAILLWPQPARRMVRCGPGVAIVADRPRMSAMWKMGVRSGSAIPVPNGRRSSVREW